MKIRNGFVSNSSSSSFIIAFDGTMDDFWKEMNKIISEIFPGNSLYEDQFRGAFIDSIRHVMDYSDVLEENEVIQLWNESNYPNKVESIFEIDSKEANLLKDGWNLNLVRNDWYDVKNRIISGLATYIAMNPRETVKIYYFGE